MYGSLQGLAGGSRQHSDTLKRRRKRWGGLRQQWKLLGLFEIDPQHEFYSLTCMMKEGLAAAIQNTIDTAPTNNLVDEDFKMKDTQIHEGFTLQTFAGQVFANFRTALGITEREYQLSLCSHSSYLQFISNSKSKADFFLTNDKRLFLKTQNKTEIRFLLGNLKIYMAHLRKYPHSLLVKFLGVHKIKIPHKRKKYFIVMQSVFYPDDRISARYDIKGCEVSRWTEPSPEGNQVIVVLKDLNFKDEYIHLGKQRSWLLCQMEIDTHFLRQLNVLDYSFLLAHQPLHHDERPHCITFGSLIVRTKKSVTPSPSPSASSAVFSDKDSYHTRKCVAEGRRQCGGSISDSGEGDASLGDEPEDFLVHNRRLLPNFKNPLHVIDGPEQRYFVGIIDIFTVYSLRKRLEHWWKRLRHPGKSFSTVSPPAYCTRLCEWVKDHSK
ncbi:Phosphatidylinositol 4-phosphate 5-kinase-like protein 1 [Merluccius polli]|uniref:Phosphatidylinositol 4-phosphate 5-kinase-like protein 1 n=1 Tax=Merluccius polli TaxID=89951 RepID=A0AA47M6W9_MERPO|nr:Phosphatidylinositol 4-phosphate 5-kinase-like protein 1 [Merluccius polli]